MTDKDRGFSIAVDEMADGTLVVELEGELDLATAPALVARFDALRGRAASCIVVDVSRVTFIDSSGLNALVSAARGMPGRVVVAAPSPHVARVLDIVRLGDVIEVEPTVEGAVRNASRIGTTDGEAA